MSFLPGGQETTITGTAAATVVSSPAASTQRMVKTIRITNVSGVAVAYTLQVNKAAAIFELGREAALAAGATTSIDRVVVLDATDESIEVVKTTAGELDVVAAYADRS